VRIIVAGGSGFLGRALQKYLGNRGHTVLTLTRRATPGDSTQLEWQPDGTAGPWAAALCGADAVLNLAGAGIADARWSDARKRALRESRLLPTKSLVAALRRASPPPSTFVSASGIGYYGNRGEEIVTEATAPGADFLATLCIDWEREAEEASSMARVAMLRSGLALHPSGGALAKLLLPFRLGLGGRIGSGRQYLPWIHLDDWTRLVEWMLVTPTAHGAFNVTAPTPATNAQFTRALGRALHRPAIVPVPSFALRLALGELADTLLTGQRAIPARAKALGFEFRFPEIDDALRELLEQRRAL
jgi:uncharacterized protein (TIGR01777 family)